VGNPMIKPEKPSLFMDFAEYFELSLALTEEQKAAVFNIRYSVYCEEFGYEDPLAFRDRMESDEFDEVAIMCLVTHKPSGKAAGCVRLVMADDHSRLPLEKHCKDTLDEEFFKHFKNLRGSMAEVSRLAVDSHFRRRRGESESRFGNTETMHFDAREKRTFPLIAVSLFLAAAAVAELVDRKHLFAIMEPILPAILRRTGFVVERVGEDFDYKGVRAPYYFDFDAAERTAPDELRPWFDAIKAQFARMLQPDGDRKVSRVLSPARTSGDYRESLRIPQLLKAGNA
jgi:N-acyl amino acid synthase of PEP-CTERM/exosortase system